MAETGTVDLCGLHMDHADIRRESATYTADVRRDVAREGGDIKDAVKTAGWQVTERVGAESDRIIAQDTAYFISGQDKAFSTAQALASLRAVQDSAFQRVQADIQLAAERTSAAATIAAEKNATATALANGVLTKLVIDENTKTRDYINTLKMADLNRELTERNAALVECRSDTRGWRQNADNMNYAALTTQMNNLLSQVQETKQGIVNFGSMAGSSGQQTSTSNNVK